MPKLKIHPSITEDVLVDACQRRDGPECDNPGFCIACGEEHYECEPDARNYKCEACGQRQVFGAEEILLMIV
jgi:hypothetical protein